MPYPAGPDGRPTSNSDDPELTRLVWDQTAAELAVPVLLFTDALLSADASAGEQPGDRAAADAHEAVRLASGLAVDLDQLALFTADAYRLQCALGEAAMVALEEGR